MVLRFLGESVTDSNGLAVLPDGYTGTGAGEIDVVAKTEIDDRIFQSETYEVLDCLALDRATSSDSTDLFTSMVGFTRNATDTTVYRELTSATSVSTNSYNISDGLCIEMEITSITSLYGIRVYPNNASSQLLQPSEPCTIRFVCTSTHIDGYIGDTKLINTDITSSESVVFQFRLASGITDFNYKNLKIYPI